MLVTGFSAVDPLNQFVFDNLPMGVLLHDGDGIIFMANQSAQNILGVSLDELLGRTLLDPCWRIVRPDGSGFPGQEHPVMQALQRREVVRDVVMGVYNPLQDRYTWIKVTSTPQVKAPGLLPDMVMTVFEDITDHRQAEIKLEQSQIYFERVFEFNPAALVITRRSDGEFLRINAAHTRMIGYQPEELYGNTALGIRIYEDPEERQKILRLLSADGRIRDYQLKIRAKSGEIRNMILSMELVQFNGEECILSALLDITHQKKIEHELADVRDFLQKMFHMGPVAKKLTRLSDRVIVDLNSAAEHMFGVSRAEITGKVTDDFDYWIDSNEHQRAVDILQQQGYIADFEFGFKTHSGETGWASYFAEIIDRGPEQYCLSEFVNNTKRHRVEQENVRLLERLNLATRSSHMGVWDWDIIKNRLVWDDQMYVLYGINEGEFGAAYETWLSGLHPDDRELNDEISKQAVRGEREYETEFRVVWPDGSVHWLKALGQVVFDEQGVPIRMVGINYDISEIKQAHLSLEESKQILERKVEERTVDLIMANAELVRANRAKDEFLSTMSHELRTPLNGILNLSESLQEGTYGALTPQQKAVLGTVGESGEHLLNLINDILDVSKAESGRMELMYDRIIIHEIIDSSLRLIQPQARKKHLRITVNNNSGLEAMVGDARRLKQMLVNLLSNSVKFTPDGGKIGLDVAVEKDNEVIRFTVWDSGIGIAKEKINQLFQPFVQLDSRLSREYTGTGLGLALVSRLAELHGGSVGVQSEQGSGSQFWFSIPVAPIGESGQAFRSIADEIPPAGKTPRCTLVIEDSPLAAGHLTHYLNEINTEVIVHPLGQDAVDVALRVNADLILLDLLLPDISGWEVLAMLKSNPKTREIPVVIISVVDERLRGLSEGASGYLVKPVSRDQLQNAISRAMSPNSQPDRQVPPIERPAGVDQHALQNGRLIVLAEDNPANLEGYIDYLKTLGFRIIPALNGYEAVEYIEEFKPDLVLMDIQMPGMDGMEAIRRLRAKPAFQRLPIIALTALAMPGDRERCLAAGANEYLAKPMGLKQLVKAIERLLGKQFAGGTA